MLPNVYQKFIKAPKTDRMDYLLDIIEPDVDKKRKVLIFCNKGSTSAFLNHYLNEKGIKTLHFAGGNMNPNHRCVDHEIVFSPYSRHYKPLLTICRPLRNQAKNQI